MNAGTHKRDPFLNLLPLFWERNTKGIPGIRQAICLRFRGKQAHDPKTIEIVPHVSTIFRSTTLKNKEQIQRFRCA